MFQKVLDSHFKKRIGAHLEPVRLSFGNVAKDIQRIDSFGKESRELIERWNQYFLSVFSQIEQKHAQHKVYEHVAHVPQIKSEISQLHSAHTALYQSLKKQNEGVEAIKNDLIHTQQQLSKMVTQYNKCMLVLFNEVKDLRKMAAHKPISEPKQPEIEEIQPVLHRKSESLPAPSVTTVAKMSSTLRQIADTLTTSERAILLILVSTDQKLSYKDIAVNYGRSPSTIKNIICHLKGKNIPLHEFAGSDGVKRYYLDDNFKKVLMAAKL